MEQVRTWVLTAGAVVLALLMVRLVADLLA